MTMPRAVALLVFSIVVAGVGIFLVVARVQSGIVNPEIESRSTGAGVGENAATPPGTGFESSGSARATVTAAVQQATALAATARAVLTPIPSTPGTGGAGVVAIGKPVELNGSRYTVHQVVDPEPPGLFRSTAGNRRIAIELTQEALTTAQTYSFSNFRLRDAGGTLHTWAITNSTPEFGTGRLEPGQARRGWISFQVPEGVELATLVVNVPGQGGGVPIVALR